MTLHLAAHRATTRHLSSAYLLQAEAALPCAGPVVGLDALSGQPFSFDPFTLYAEGIITNPNLLVLGQLGTGKSTLAKLLCWGLSALCGHGLAVLDPKGEYGPLAELLGLARLRLEPGGRTRLNPLEATGAEAAADARRRGAEVVVALASSGLGRALRPDERAAVEVALGCLAESPCLPAVVEALLSPTAAMAQDLRTSKTALALSCREAALELRRLVAGDLAGMLDAPSTVRLDPAGPGVVIDLSACYRSPAALGPVMVAAGTWLTETLARPGRRRVLVLDETWQVLGDPGVGRWLRSTMKLARALGVAVALLTHTLSDFESVGTAGSEAARLSSALVADTATRALLAQPDPAVGRTAEILDLGPPEAALLPRLARGRALWRVGPAAALVHHLVLNDLELPFVPRN